ncbi:MAG TPA: FAD-binding oxidoreductase [Amycolatopsis sp.]|uniref:NAD(P)/FAD-dependent oxidoreductase n=1 Tax=Amycolatopsis sp. TaxID=37632 RepID=UPI002B47DA31|nr:FAD-binding oxidoreductase [Amycolatopsis sp.]HKS45028.1 FAD-binding oxidoreductase [Amycolatopsis sp.]
MPRSVPESASVVVIGGGVIGTSIAFHLARAGVPDVVLVERDELAEGSTSKAAGGVRASFSDPANVALGLRGLEAYSTFASDHRQEIDFRRDGYLYLLSDQDSVDVFTESTAVQNHYGVPSRMITPEAAQRLSPLVATDGLLAAAWSPDDAKATPEAVVQGYARSARRLGARIIRHCAVQSIERDGRAIRGVTTSLGTIRTENVVCAAGAWSALIGDMLGVRIPVQPVRRQIAFTEPVPGTPRHTPLTIDFPSSFYFHAEGRGMLVGWSDPAQPAGFDLDFSLGTWLEGLGEIAAVRAPALLEAGIVSGWAGLYEVTPDHTQIIDRSEEVEGLLIATGFSGHGFLMGPAAGEIIRDLFLGRTPRYDISAFTLSRFRDSADRPRETNII